MNDIEKCSNYVKKRDNEECMGASESKYDSEVTMNSYF